MLAVYKNCSECIIWIGSLYRNCMITAKMVKDLREKTGLGMMDCKKALVEKNGNIEEAITFLRENSKFKAEKKSSRITAEGIVDSYIHGGGRIGVLIEVNVETDFAAKNEEFKQLVKDIAMQVAANNPKYVKSEDISEEVIEKEKSILRAQALNEGRPEHIVDKMVDGRIKKYYKEVCLIEQPFIKNPDVTLKEVITEKIQKIGENISVRRFVRFEKGEGLEKRDENFADEVQKQVKG